MGPDHVGLLVNGVFNASIPSAKIPPAFRPDAGETNRLVNQLTGQIIEAGAEVTFTVTAYGGSGGPRFADALAMGSATATVAQGVRRGRRRQPGDAEHDPHHRRVASPGRRVSHGEFDPISQGPVHGRRRAVDARPAGPGCSFM